MLAVVTLVVTELVFVTMVVTVVMQILGLRVAPALGLGSGRVVLLALNPNRASSCDLTQTELVVI